MAEEIRRETRTIEGREVTVIVYDNGSERRAENGHWLKPPDGAGITTSERGRELIKRRYQLAQERAAQGMIKGLGLDPAKASASDAWERANEIFWSRFAETKNIRGMAESFEKLGKAAGFLTNTDHDQDADNKALTSALLAWLRKRAEQATRDEPGMIDAEVTDDAAET